MQKIKVALVEDVPEYADVLESTINNHPVMECVQWYDNGEDALKYIPTLLPDVVLVDLGLPGVNGLEVIENLKKDIPKIQFLVITVSDEDDKIFTALSVGASGYLLKNSSADEIADCILDMVNGGAPMSTQIARKVIQYFQDNQVSRVNPYEKLLTNREKEILHLLSKGHLYKQIASDLYISIQTVKTHCHNIYEKLHVSSRTEAVRAYYNYK